jgi:hypothetical protein
MLDIVGPEQLRDVPVGVPRHLQHVAKPAVVAKVGEVELRQVRTYRSASVWRAHAVMPSAANWR